MKLCQDILINVMVHCEIKDILNYIIINKNIYNNFNTYKNYIGILKLKQLNYKNFLKLDTNYYNIYEYIYCNRADLLRSILIDNKIDIIKFLYENNIKHNMDNLLPLQIAIKYNSIDILKFLINLLNNKIKNEKILNYALSIGNFEIIKLLYLNNFKCSDNGIDYAIITGNINIIKWLYSKNIRYTTEALNICCKYNYLECIKFLCYTGISCTTEAMDIASEYGHINIVKWFHNNTNVGCTTNAIDLASRGGHLNIVRYLHSISKKCTENAMDNAAEYGHINIMKFLLKIGKTGTKYGLFYSIKNGNIDIVKWLYSNFTKLNLLNNEVIQYAIESGDLKMINYLYFDKDACINKSDLYKSIYYKQTDIFKFLYKYCKKKYKNSVLLNYAIIHNSLDIVKIIYNNTLYYAPINLALAKRTNRFEIIDFLESKKLN